MVPINQNLSINSSAEIMQAYYIATKFYS